MKTVVEESKTESYSVPDTFLGSKSHITPLSNAVMPILQT